MSQVIVTQDKLKSSRAKSAAQEHKIDREGRFNRWRRNDISGFDPVAAGAGVLAAPVLAVFWIFSKIAQVAIYAALLVSKVVGKIVGPMRY
jgi:hypothetical protein